MHANHLRCFYFIPYSYENYIKGLYTCANKDQIVSFKASYTWTKNVLIKFDTKK